MLRIYFLMICILVPIPILKAQYIELYLLLDLEEKTNQNVGFISLSDNYSLSEHPDSLAIPNFYELGNDNIQYFKLTPEYRNRFISKTNILETDSIFVYDYSTDVLFSFPIKDLNVVAHLSIYKSINDCPCDQYDYMIGFEIDKSSLKGLGSYYSHVLVYVGKENPFEQGGMKPITWNKIISSEFPLEKTKFRYTITERGNAYLFESDDLKFFLQDRVQKNSNRVNGRHLMVIEKKSGEVISEMVFESSEGSSLTPLNFGIDNPNYIDLQEQWTGKLFKNKPNVVLGFEWVSFGCPGIFFLSTEEQKISLNCDNRH